MTLNKWNALKIVSIQHELRVGAGWHYPLSAEQRGDFIWIQIGSQVDIRCVRADIANYIYRGCLHACVSLLRASGSNDAPTAKRTVTPKAWFPYCSLIKGISDTGQQTGKRSLDGLGFILHLVVHGVRKSPGHSISTDTVRGRDTDSTTSSSHRIQNSLSYQMNTVGWYTVE